MHPADGGEELRDRAIRFINDGHYCDARLIVRRLALPGSNGDGSDIEAELLAREIVDVANKRYLTARAQISLEQREYGAALVYVWALCLKY